MSTTTSLAIKDAVYAVCVFCFSTDFVWGLPFNGSNFIFTRVTPFMLNSGETAAFKISSFTERFLGALIGLHESSVLTGAPGLRGFAKVALQKINDAKSRTNFIKSPLIDCLGHY